MYGFEDAEWEKWRQKRRHTLAGLVIIGLSMGIDTSVVFSTLFLYLRDVVKTNNAQVWYGVIISFYFIASAVFGMIGGRWLDQTMKVRLYANISIIAQIVGYILYTVSIHPIFLLVGRMFCGMSDPFISVVSGEMLRIYDNKESTVAIVILSSVYAVGFMAGPALNFLFTDISFTLGPIHVNYTNFIGIFMPCWLVFCLLISNLLVHDCSRQFDLKEYLKRSETENALMLEKSTDEDIKSNNNCLILGNTVNKDGEEVLENTCLVKTPNADQNDIPILTVFRVLITNEDTLLILAATVFFMYGIFAVTALQPLLITITLQWSLQSLSILYLCMGVLQLVLLFTLGICVTTDRSIYFTCILAIVSQIINCGAIICMKTSPRLFSRDVVLVCVFAVTLVLGYNFDDVMIKVLFSKMVPSKIQSFSESIRNGLTSVSIVAGSFTVAVVLPVSHWWSVGIAVIYAIVLSGFLVRKKHLIKPREIDFRETTEKAESNF